jgi:hypothetical protein
MPGEETKGDVIKKRRTKANLDEEFHTERIKIVRAEHEKKMSMWEEKREQRKKKYELKMGILQQQYNQSFAFQLHIYQAGQSTNLNTYVEM